MFFRSRPGAYHRRLKEVEKKAKEREAKIAAAPRPFTVPDLLHKEPFLAVDGEALLDLLGLGFLGKDLGGALDEALSKARVAGECWKPEFFVDDLFVREFATACSQIRIGGTVFPANRAFLTKMLSHVPADLETVRLRQGILREIESDRELARSFEELYRAVFSLLSLFETPGYQGSLDTAAVHLEILQQSKAIIDRMERDFESATSGLHRLHEAGAATQASEEYKTLASLLEYERSMAELALQVRIGGDGKIRSVRVEGIEENGENPFHVNPLQRLSNRLRLLASGYDFTTKELMKRLVNEVFDRLSPALIPLIQLLGHLEFYLASIDFKRQAEGQGLAVCLADIDDDRPLELERLFNPLLLRQEERTVPCGIVTGSAEAITLVTGPNSGGKTRLLQALAWAQLLGQSGVYTCAARARQPLVAGLFVSLVENESADQIEGRLGRELVRIRSLFEEIRPRSMVVLDELCSGTNPSEGVEVFALVVKLLRQVRPTAFVTTHFLDFARSLEENPPIDELEFLRVELDEHQLSTYQFVGGVAPTSLASLTAARLGVTFERLSSLLNER